VSYFTHILWREPVAYHEETMMNMFTLVEHPDKGKTLNTLFLIYFLWYYNIDIDGFDKQY
jgi:hypothetical protein